ncbi:MAG: response regulator [Deltaproteobacteria bacterium]|nr:response regulator [Deltaproteobacteria bacterium]
MLKRLQSAEARLQLTEQRYRSLIESIPDIIYTMDLDGSLSFISPRWKTILGHDESEVLGQYFIHFAPPEEHPFLIQVFKEARNYKKNVENVHWQYFRKDGQRRYFLGSAAPMLGAEGQVNGIIGIARDVTEHKLLEEQLLQAQKMESIGNLAGGIAHDFNNLLGGILGYATFLKRKLTAKHALYPSAVSIEKSAQRAAELTRQLLGFARPGKSEIRPIDCNAVIRELILLLKRTIDRRIAVAADLEAHLPGMEGDEIAIHQSLMNICLNARDAMPQGGRLLITTRKKMIIPDQAARQRGLKGGPYIQITVSDTGTGIGSEVRGQIFDPFFTTKDPGRGTGLGLAIVYGIIQNHGGYIEVQSQVGQGTVFTLLLPAIPAARSRKVNPPALFKEVQGEETVLLVDDEEIIRELGADLLEDRGYRVLLAADGREAINIYKERNLEISLIILDVVMPGMGGKETFQQLKALNPRVKVLLSSGYSAKGEVGEILKLGAAGFIQKPYREEELAARARELLDIN